MLTLHARFWVQEKEKKIKLIFEKFVKTGTKVDGNVSPCKRWKPQRQRWWNWPFWAQMKRWIYYIHQKYVGRKIIKERLYKMSHILEREQSICMRIYTYRSSRPIMLNRPYLHLTNRPYYYLIVAQTDADRKPRGREGRKKHMYWVTSVTFVETERRSHLSKEKKQNFYMPSKDVPSSSWVLTPEEGT